MIVAKIGLLELLDEARIALPKTTQELRCHSCSHCVGVSSAPMRMVGMFAPDAFGRIDSRVAEQIKRRCRSCGWLNVFVPATRDVAEVIEMKGR